MYISPLYVGSITDVQLTQASGFLETVSDKPGISIMADRGFTIKEMLQAIGVQLNTPPFLEGRRQLPAEEISTGRKIASLLCLCLPTHLGKCDSWGCFVGIKRPCK